MSQADTSQEARQVLLDIYRRMSPAVKFERIFSAYQFGKMLAMAGLRELHPNATEKRIWYLWANCHLGEKLFNEVYGTIPDD
jgi:hypothetical protein